MMMGWPVVGVSKRRRKLNAYQTCWQAIYAEGDGQISRTIARKD